MQVGQERQKLVLHNIWILKIFRPVHIIITELPLKSEKNIFQCYSMYLNFDFRALRVHLVLKVLLLVLQKMYVWQVFTNVPVDLLNL